MKVWTWVVARLDEPSTWAGIAAGCLAVGQALSTHTTWGPALLAGIVAVLKAEK